MDSPALIDSLNHFPDLLRATIADRPVGELRRRPESGGWSLLEILGHLADEEEFDFRVRLELTLLHPEHDWPAPVAPEQWVVERRYNDADAARVLLRFGTLRTGNVRWLRALKNPDWSVAHKHPKFGDIRAGDLLAAWAAHDLLHLRQIARRLYDDLAERGAPFSTRYAGAWPTVERV